ncbi:MAG: NAD(P)-binding protein [Myxococcales bacterium]|nr:NAD(P)-binding protein [Myxococcales bacterium]
MTRAPIQILGAGLTGMSAAHHLGGDCEIHERLAAPGGHAITLQERGYRFDRTGHLLHLRDPDIRRWVEQLLPGRLIEVQRRSMVFSQGVYTRYPYQANTYGLPPTTAHECLMGFLQARERAARTPEPADFEQFCLKHFGDGFSRHFMIPYNQKLWGVHPREISPDWCSRFVPLPQLDDVIAGAVGLNDRELGYNRNFLYPRSGIAELSEALCASLPVAPRFEHAPRAIDHGRRVLHFDDGDVPYQRLISSAPLDRLVDLLQAPPAEVSRAAASLRCTPLWYLDVALERPSGIDMHWVYVPEARFPFYRVGCYSNFSAEMAPPGKACLYVELASRQQPDMDTLLPQVTAGLIEMGIIEAPGDIAFATPRRIDHAYVIYDHSYQASVAIIEAFLEQHGIISTGRYGGWNYSSMEDALIFGRQAAARAREQKP